jgi:hypothetical protein
VKQGRRRGRAIEYTLIALMVGLAALQVLLVAGTRAGSI